ncbi:MAG: hypothetical protein IKC81_04605 [Paludibacteraceae bacterium]|nr:hypothetical protein [Paludibacteraceae bacterium]
MIPIKITPKQIAMIIGCVLALIVVTWAIFSIKGRIGDAVTNSKLIDEVNKEIDTEKITVTQSQINTLVSKLYTAMSGWGTNESAIFDAFGAINSYSDLQSLNKTFGVRESKTLREWLQDELSTEDLNHVNEILASKNINYVF